MTAHARFDQTVSISIVSPLDILARRAGSMRTRRAARVNEIIPCQVSLTLQTAIAARSMPSESLFETVAQAALSGAKLAAELTVRVVGRVESRRLNRRFRGLNSATNVLSFASEGLADIAPDYLGDIVICGPLVVTEARSQAKSRDHHYSHLLVHGILHLLGFDHVSEPEAELMEAREREILAQLGIPDPYAVL